MIPYSRQSIDEHDVRAVAKAIRSDYVTQGPAITQFERLLAQQCGAKYAVVFSSGTAALHAAYFAAGVGKGDEVLTSPLTFAATANAALYLDATPIFADVDPATGNLDPKNVEGKISKRTKVLVPVDYAGRPAELEALRRIARKHKLVMVDDGAQSLGASYQGKKVGTQADMTMFSFHPAKSITTGEGGAILTDNAAYFKKLAMFRTHGITKDAGRLVKKGRAAWYHEMHFLGYNYRMTDIQAALGSSQMRKLSSHVSKRRALAKRYFTLLKGIPSLTLPPADDATHSSAWHLFAIRVPARIRDRVFTALRRSGIGVQVHYLPVYLHPYYASLGYEPGACPNAERFASEVISIPLYPDLTHKQQDVVVAKIKAALSTNRV
jgi:UDP-4-amino-4,6-dideoxy-N-acetyl-beta-L-altrosamine transaminase